MRSPSTLRTLLHALTSATLLAGAPAFADEPAKSVPETSAEKPTEKPAEQPAETTDARPAQGGLTAAELERAFKRYRKQVRNGNTVYCRSEKPVGTRIGKQVCYSEGQVIATARAERDARDQMSQMNVCGGGSCTPGS